MLPSTLRAGQVTTYSQRHEHGVPGEQTWNRRRPCKAGEAMAVPHPRESCQNGSPLAATSCPIPSLLVPPDQRPCFATPLAVLPPAHCTLPETAKCSTRQGKRARYLGASTPPTYPSSIVCPSATRASPRSQPEISFCPCSPGQGALSPRKSIINYTYWSQAWRAQPQRW